MQRGGDETSLQQDLFLQRSKTLPVRFVFFRWSKRFSPLITWPNQIFLGKFFPMVNSRCALALPVRLKEASAEAHALEPHQTHMPTVLPSAQDFQSISPKFSQMLHAEALPQGTAVCAARQEPSSTRRDQLGLGHVLVWSCSPSLAPCC